MTSLIKRIPGVAWLYNSPRLLSFYHLSLAWLGAAFYGFPSRKMIVIGVTGTKGKTTTCNLITQILSAAGHKVGMATTVNFKIDDKEWVNDTKQNMLGRFALQGLMRKMVRAGCRYAVIETSSEGVLQHRQRFIDYKIAVFTNISPEHIERHGGFENYRAAKIKLFEQVAEKNDGIGVYNLDDENIEMFFVPDVRYRYGYGISAALPNPNLPEANQYQISGIGLSAKKSSFLMGGHKYEIPLVGKFNISNAATAACVAISQKISPETIAEALAYAKPVPGRFEVLENKGLKVVVDYAHEPASLRALYGAVKLLSPRRVIGIIGAQGGGRDEWKRGEMGKIAAGVCHELILTNEDPYDDDPIKIVDDIEKSIPEKQRHKIKKIIDRAEAIKTAIQDAVSGDVVVISGKGGEVWMCVAGGKKIPWSDRKIAEKELGL